MTGLKEMLISEKRRLLDIVKKTEKQLERIPEGTLRISSSHKCPQFYHKFEGTGKDGIYLGERLIVTFETSKQVLNTYEFEEMLKKYVL